MPQLTALELAVRVRGAGMMMLPIIIACRSDVSVLSVLRGLERIPAYAALRLQAGDVLVMEGPASTIGQLLQSPEFVLKQELEIGEETLRSEDLVTIEALVAPGSDYAGATLEEVEELRIPTGFRRKAQGCEERATLGNWCWDGTNPNGVVPHRSRCVFQSHT